MGFKLPPHVFTPPTHDDLLEFGREMSQDDALLGFQNLGAKDNSIDVTVTTAQSINGQGGDDRITVRGNTNDTILGGSGDDTIDGGNGVDTIKGGSGNDDILGGGGADIISGGSGDDFLAGDNDGISFSLHGVDTISGGSGRDTLYGGGKADILTGGSGADTFLYRVGFGASNESKVGEADFITDFQAGSDKIDVSLVVASSTRPDDFHFSDTPTTAAGTFFFVTEADGQHVFFNLDTGAPDMEIIVHTTSGVLSASDFLL